MGWGEREKNLKAHVIVSFRSSSFFFPLYFCHLHLITRESSRRFLSFFFFFLLEGGGRKTKLIRSFHNASITYIVSNYHQNILLWSEQTDDTNLCPIQANKPAFFFSFFFHDSNRIRSFTITIFNKHLFSTYSFIELRKGLEKRNQQEPFSFFLFFYFFYFFFPDDN